MVAPGEHVVVVGGVRGWICGSISQPYQHETIFLFHHNSPAARLLPCLCADVLSWCCKHVYWLLMCQDTHGRLPLNFNLHVSCVSTRGRSCCLPRLTDVATSPRPALCPPPGGLTSAHLAGLAAAGGASRVTLLLRGPLRIKQASAGAARCRRGFCPARLCMDACTFAQCCVWQGLEGWPICIEPPRSETALCKLSTLCAVLQQRHHPPANRAAERFGVLSPQPPSAAGRRSTDQAPTNQIPSHCLTIANPRLLSPNAQFDVDIEFMGRLRGEALADYRRRRGGEARLAALKRALQVRALSRACRHPLQARTRSLGQRHACKLLRVACLQHQMSHLRLGACVCEPIGVHRTQSDLSVFFCCSLPSPFPATPRPKPRAAVSRPRRGRRWSRCGARACWLCTSTFRLRGRSGTRRPAALPFGLRCGGERGRHAPAVVAGHLAWHAS
jgi:hypothetical protein